MKHFIIKLISGIVFVSIPCHSKAQQPMPIDSITTSRTIYATERPLNNIVVTATGNLSVKSLGNVILDTPFEVKVGGVLDITTLEPTNLIYQYDNSGNRIARRLED